MCVTKKLLKIIPEVLNIQKKTLCRSVEGRGEDKYSKKKLIFCRNHDQMRKAKVAITHTGDKSRNCSEIIDSLVPLGETNGLI